MSDYIVSARKYRPATFDSVVGQRALTTTLKNAIASGRLAHAYLFCGPRGVGKTTSARIFAKTINCLHPRENGEACDACESCIAFNEQRSYNIHELDAASNNSVDDIRGLIEQVQVPPQVGRYKVFIIDEVHMLSQAAFNAFLKTLEEPPAHAIFILATTEKHKILPTILSRCQIYDFNRMEVPDIVAHLKRVAEQEGYTYEEEALGVIAQKADGGMRDALSIFDQVASFTQGHITYAQVIDNLNVLDYDYYFALTDQLLACDIPQAMLTLNEILSKGFEANHFIGGLASHFRDLLVSRDAVTLPLLEVAETVRQRYQEQAQRCQPRFLYRALRLCNDCDINYRTSRNKRLLVELTLIEVAQLTQADDEAASGGRSPKRLLPIFPRTAAQPAVAPAAQPATPTAAPAGSPSATPSVAASSPTAPAASGTASTYAATHAAGSANSTSAAPTATRPEASMSVGMRRLQAAMGSVRVPSPGGVPRPVGTPLPHPIGASVSHTAGSQQPGATAQGATPASPQTTVGSSATAAAPAAPQQQTPIDESVLAREWLVFANSLPVEEAAEAGRLKIIDPILRDNFRVEGAVQNATAANYLRQIVPQLTAHLRRALRNDFITVDFVVNETAAARRAFSPREILTQMHETNPQIAVLIKELGLQLA